MQQEAPRNRGDSAPWAVTCQSQSPNCEDINNSPNAYQVLELSGLASGIPILPALRISALGASSRTVIRTAGTRNMSVTEVHISAPAHSWSSNADIPDRRGALRYAG